MYLSQHMGCYIKFWVGNNKYLVDVDVCYGYFHPFKMYRGVPEHYGHTVQKYVCWINDQKIKVSSTAWYVFMFEWIKELRVFSLQGSITSTYFSPN